MMNTNGTGGTNDDQQMLSMTDRENFIGRLTTHFGGNRETAVRYHDAAYARSGGNLAAYKRVLQALIQRNQQQQQQQIYAQPQPTYELPMNVKQESQATLGNMQTRMPPQTFPVQQQQQIYAQPQPTYELPTNVKQESQVNFNNMQTRIPTQTFPMQQQIRPQQQQQPPPPPPQYIQQPIGLLSQNSSNVPVQQRTLVQHLQQPIRAQHQPEPPQLQSTPVTNSSTLPQSSSASGGQDEILQQLLSSPNPPKPSLATAQNVTQARLRNLNRNIRQTHPPTQSTQQQSSPMTPNSDSLISSNNINSVPSPLPHTNTTQQSVPGQSPLARYMLSQSPQNPMYRPPMSPMNIPNYTNSPTTTIIDDEIQFLSKFFAERLPLLNRAMSRCQQEGQLEKFNKYRQLNEQISIFLRNPSVEQIALARRLKEYLDRLFIPQPIDQTVSSSTQPINRPLNNTNNSIFEQCQRLIGDYLSKDTTLKSNITKRFIEPLCEVHNGVPHKIIRLDLDSNVLPTNQTEKTLAQIIKNELSQLPASTFSYELKPYQQMRTKSRNSIPEDYELTCRFTRSDKPIVPPLKLKLQLDYPREPPEILSLNQTPIRLENSDGNLFFESISRNFVYFLRKLPTEHTISDILDIWRTAIENASES